MLDFGYLELRSFWVLGSLSFGYCGFVYVGFGYVWVFYL